MKSRKGEKFPYLKGCYSSDSNKVAIKRIKKLSEKEIKLEDFFQSLREEEELQKSMQELGKTIMIGSGTAEPPPSFLSKAFRITIIWFSTKITPDELLRYKYNPEDPIYDNTTLVMFDEDEKYCATLYKKVKNQDKQEALNRILEELIKAHEFEAQMALSLLNKEPFIKDENEEAEKKHKKRPPNVLISKACDDLEEVLKTNKDKSKIPELVRNEIKDVWRIGGEEVKNIKQVAKIIDAMQKLDTVVTEVKKTVKYCTKCFNEIPSNVIDGKKSEGSVKKKDAEKQLTFGCGHMICRTCCDRYLTKPSPIITCPFNDQIKRNRCHYVLNKEELTKIGWKKKEDNGRAEVFTNSLIF